MLYRIQTGSNSFQISVLAERTHINLVHRYIPAIGNILEWFAILRRIWFCCADKTDELLTKTSSVLNKKPVIFFMLLNNS
jgi:hypothetical protein